MGVTVIRPPAVYGPRDRAILKVFALAKRHLQPVLRSGGSFSMIHVVGLASAGVLALSPGEASGGVFFSPQPHPTPHDEEGGLGGGGAGARAGGVAVPPGGGVGVGVG